MTLKHIGFVVLAVALAGCTSGRIAESEKAVEGFEKLRTTLAESQVEVNNVLAALNQLGTGADLQKSFTNYISAVDKLKASGDASKERGESMRKNFDAYVARWQQEMDKVSDPAIKSSLEQRRDAVGQQRIVGVFTITAFETAPGWRALRIAV